MEYLEYLHSFLCFFILAIGFMAAFSQDPIETILCLILVFFNAGVILFSYKAEFIGLSFIIIYVGAIAVLFLFVITMLQVKKDPYQLFKSELIGDFFIYFLLIGSYCFFFDEKVLAKISSFDILFSFDNLNNIDVFGQFLFNYYLECFLLAGLLLLIPLIGSIVLTFNFKKN